MTEAGPDVAGAADATARLPADAAARAAALDPTRSFIVQAPAGAGKTEILTRRLLVLLARAEAPEEIVALTFTRKAAAEMRHRVLAALARARDDAPPADAHARETWQLARAACAHAAAAGWDLAAQPGRLRVLTIDGLCALLARRLPLASGLGGLPALPDDATPLYREAARATLALLEDGSPEQAAAVATLLLHLDNRNGALEDQLVSMLARRDQWLRHLADHDAALDRERLEAVLAALWRETGEALQSLLAPLAARLVAIAAGAAARLPADGASPLAACVELDALPAAAADDAPRWLGLAELLLTRDGGWRQRIDYKLGFPPKSAGRDAAEKRLFDERKQALLDLIADCEKVPGLAAALAALRDLPPPRYGDAQWEVLAAAVQVLRLAAAQLALVFADRGAADHPAVAAAARSALGSAEQPSDLLLALDARIRHLLVDEFQDTSVGQFDLLERLTAGWSGGDGRTLFVVGDPMQSIYRFREAEVGLFLRARRHGLGALRLTPLALTTNFRSARGIVDWVNAAFVQALPAAEDIARGAAPYAPATHWHPAQPGEAVRVHAQIGADAGAEARQVAAIVADARAQVPAASIAVLVRSRPHLAAIVPALRAASVPLRAVEIEPLGARPVVLDLLALTRALRHPADRIAWLALLRAPFCGLLLADLHVLAAADARRPLWPLLAAWRDDPALAPDARARLAACIDALAPALAAARRGRLRDAVAGAWLRLGGADCLRAPRDDEDAQAYLALLGEVEEAGDLADLDALETRVQQLFAAPDPAPGAAAVEVMTIHKAKGLEFDVVIVPGLHRAPRRDEAPLLAWQERPRAGGGADLLLAARRGADGVGDPVHDWILAFERDRARLETARLLYVAATRARSRLHLLASARAQPPEKGEGLALPAADSLLAPLWPVVAAQFEAARAAAPAPATAAPGGAADEAIDPRHWRRAAPALLRADDARLPAPPWQGAPPVPGDHAAIRFDWAGEGLRLVGTVVHRWLQRIAGDPAAWDAARIDALAPQLVRELAALGLPAADRAAAGERAAAALRGTLADARGRWLLAPRGAAAAAASELRLTGIDQGQLVDVAIDRSFVEDGRRWVIDFKTGAHEGGDREHFLDNEVLRYRAQLARYARLAAALGPEPVRCGLYFPLLGGWREWDPEPAPAAG